MGRLTISLAVMAAGLTGCRMSAPAPPADPLIDGLRAEEREAGFTYAEGQGRQLFRQYCATCHGDEAKGDGQNASMLDPAPPDFTSLKRLQDPGYIHRVITGGSAAVGRSPLSPPWGRSLHAQEIEYLVAYCHRVAFPKPAAR